MTWWMQNNLRTIQNNLRDIDAGMDIDRHIEWLKSFDVNVLQIGCGGITAFHPTKLDCQWENPYMKGDFLKEVVAKCHDNGIRVIARFDFSKTHEIFYKSNPSWYSRKKDGSPVRYHDTVATCVNGEYQRKRSLEIIKEVLENYEVDGIFFNMFGYITFDYSGNHVGICQCENCKSRFYEMYGEELPEEENEADPVFEKYQAFKSITVNEILTDIHHLTKSVSPDIAVSTYAFHGIDIIRNESNSAVDRPLPFWIYNSSDNVGLIEGSFDDKIISNCVINAVDLPYRFMGVSKYLTQIRLYENMAAGSGLDWCIIGNFDDYPDYENLNVVREVFQYHKTYESYYGHFKHTAKVMLVHDGDRRSLNKEYRGIFRMLKEEHIPFRIVDVNTLEDKGELLDDYDLILLPAVKRLPAAAREVLADTTACVAGSGLALAKDGALVEELFGVRLKERITDVRGTYLLTEPKSVFSDFEQKQWVFLDKDYCEMELLKGTGGLLPKIEKAMFGPPERCFGHERTDSSMMSVSSHGNIYIPWMIGEQYYQYGYDEFKRLFLDVTGIRKTRPFDTNAPEMLELFFSKRGDTSYLLQCVNLTGFNGTTFFEPLGLSGIFVKFKELQPGSVREMGREGLKDISYDDSGMALSLEKGEVYKAYLIEL
ncbi:hypothetical protein AALB39_21200 [Lachnospiraceae bacterium 54-53]